MRVMEWRRVHSLAVVAIVVVTNGLILLSSSLKASKDTVVVPDEGRTILKKFYLTSPLHQIMSR